MSARFIDINCECPDPSQDGWAGWFLCDACKKWHLDECAIVESDQQETTKVCQRCVQLVEVKLIMDP